MKSFVRRGALLKRMKVIGKHHELEHLFEQRRSLCTFAPEPRPGRFDTLLKVNLVLSFSFKVQLWPPRTVCRTVGQIRKQFFSLRLPAPVVKTRCPHWLSGRTVAVRGLLVLELVIFEAKTISSKNRPKTVAFDFT